MHHEAMSRRRVLRTALATLGVFGVSRRGGALAARAEIKMPDNIPVETFDFESQGIEGWTTVDGQWAVEDMAGAPSGKKVLVQRATRNQFNVIVAPLGPYTDVDVSRTSTTGDRRRQGTRACAVAPRPPPARRRSHAGLARR